MHDSQQRQQSAAHAALRTVAQMFCFVAKMHERLDVSLETARGCVFIAREARGFALPITWQ